MNAFYYTRWDKLKEIVQQGMMNETDADSAWKVLEQKYLSEGDTLIGTMVYVTGECFTFYHRRN